MTPPLTIDQDVDSRAKGAYCAMLRYWSVGCAAPWKVRSEFRRILSTPYIRAYLALKGVRVGANGRFYGSPLVQRHRHSSIAIGASVSMRSWRSSNPLVPNYRVVLATRSERARISIGDGSGLTGTVIVAAEEVRIGRRVLIGSNCVIADTDFHPIAAEARRRAEGAGATAPIVIEDDVFIGMRSILLKGVIVGSSSVVGAGSVVVSDIPAGCVAAGNPARVIKRLDEVASVERSSVDLRL